MGRISAGLRALGTVSVLLVAVAATVAVAGPAQAHADLVATSPADEETLASAPPTVQLTFSEEISPEYAFASVTVDGLAGPRLDVVQGSDAQTLSVDVSELRAAGLWRIEFRITSVDGHTIEGQFGFDVTEGPSMQAVDTVQPADGAREGSWAGTAIVIAVVVLVVLVVVRLRLRSRSRDPR